MNTMTKADAQALLDIMLQERSDAPRVEDADLFEAFLALERARDLSGSAGADGVGLCRPAGRNRFYSLA